MKTIPIINTKEVSNAELIKHVCSLMDWCRKNAKEKWRVDTLKAEQNKHIFTFSFESEKDAMMFMLYRRY